MKKILAIIFGASVLMTTSLHAKTANEILAEPDSHVEKSVLLDVAFLRPVRWVSPAEGFALFWAMTYDRKSKSPGGEILLVAPEDQREQLVRKFGVVADGTRRIVSTNPLRATLRTTNAEQKRGMFYLDLTDGEASEAMNSQEESLRSRGRTIAPKR